MPKFKVGDIICRKNNEKRQRKILEILPTHQYRVCVNSCDSSMRGGDPNPLGQIFDWEIGNCESYCKLLGTSIENFVRNKLIAIREASK